MSLTSKIIHVCASGDLLFVAKSKKARIDWCDALIIDKQQVYQTLHTDSSHPTIVKRSLLEYITHEHMPIGLFRLFIKEGGLTNQEIARAILKPAMKKLPIWQRLSNWARWLFGKKPKYFPTDLNKNNTCEVKDLILKYFKKKTLQELEQSGLLIRLL